MIKSLSYPALVWVKKLFPNNCSEDVLSSTFFQETGAKLYYIVRILIKSKNHAIKRNKSDICRALLMKIHSFPKRMSQWIGDDYVFIESLIRNLLVKAEKPCAKIMARVITITYKRHPFKRVITIWFPIIEQSLKIMRIMTWMIYISRERPPK